ETDSGIDIRRTWSREAENARGQIRPYFAGVRDAVARGDSLSSALASAGSVFPPLFREMADVGEKTGTLSKVFQRLEMHYTRQVQARRLFIGAITWPMIELAMAIFVVGVLIYVLGIVAQHNNGQPIDILGFGLIGTKGLLIYTNFVVAVFLCIGGLVIALQRG